MLKTSITTTLLLSQSRQHQVHKLPTLLLNSINDKISYNNTIILRNSYSTNNNNESYYINKYNNINNINSSSSNNISSSGGSLGASGHPLSSSHTPSTSWRNSSVPPSSYYLETSQSASSSNNFGVNNVIPGKSSSGSSSSSVIGGDYTHQQNQVRNKLFGDHKIRGGRATPLSMSKEMKTKIFDQESFGGRDSSTQYLADTRSFKVLEVDHSGQLIDQIIFKNNLSIEMKLQARDLRTIDSSFPPQMPAILARDKVFIVSIGFIRAIVQHNKIIFFDPQNPLIRNELVPIMKEYLVSQNLFFTETLTLPFEFKVLESILVFICKKLTSEHQRICSSIAKELESLNENPEHNLETLLLYHKKGLNQFEVTIKEIMDALSRLLESDEDMALMYLSFRNITGGTRKKNQHEELEILLENYMRQLEQISNEINQLKETLSSTEEFVNFQLDTARNKMMRMNLMLSLVTMSAGMGSMVTGFFGMNLVNGFEHHPYSFLTVCGCVVAGGLTTFGLIKYYCHVNNILPYTKKQKFRFGNSGQAFQNPFQHGNQLNTVSIGLNHPENFNHHQLSSSYDPANKLKHIGNNNALHLHIGSTIQQQQQNLREEKKKQKFSLKSMFRKD